MTALEREDANPASLNAAEYEAIMKREYGNMFPKSGVYFTPDLKVIEVLRYY
jgi:hypothetical protein